MSLRYKVFLGDRKQTVAHSITHLISFIITFSAGKSPIFSSIDFEKFFSKALNSTVDLFVNALVQGCDVMLIVT